ncbi:MAG TPA: hypothetical protein VE800_04025 [Actinomycetota bacterium]|nr:hypothetical protein [Actinomycetota bacterium]
MEPSAGATAPPSVSLTHPSARGWLVAVGVAYAAFQLVAFDVDRAPSWDEAVYLSQVAPGAEAYHFTAWRARGVTFLVAPLAVTGSIAVVRVGLALLAAAALVGAFLPWVRTIDGAAPLAAAFLGSSWTALFYGSEAMPNLWVGFAGVAALGFVTTRTTAGGGTRDDVAAAGSLFAAAMFRPFDAIVLAAIVAVASFVVGRRSIRWAGLPAVGAGSGCLVWLGETAGRYGGVSAALDQASVVTRLAVPDPWERVVQYLATADGPSIGPVGDPGISIPVVATAVFLTVAVAVAVVDARRRSRSPRPVLAAAGGATCFVAAYVGLVGVVAPRFLLPAVALVSVPVGSGLVALGRDRHPALRAVLLVPAAAWLLWQGSLAVRLESGAARERAAVQDVGRVIGSLTDGRPCVVASVVGAPQLGLASGCRGRSIVDVGSVDATLTEEAHRGIERVFLVLETPLDRIPPGTSERRSVKGPGTRSLTIYRVDG